MKSLIFLMTFLLLGAQAQNLEFGSYLGFSSVTLSGSSEIKVKANSISNITEVLINIEKSIQSFRTIGTVIVDPSDNTTTCSEGQCASTANCNIVQDFVYQCSCQNGYTDDLSATDNLYNQTTATGYITYRAPGVNCTDIDECATSGTCGVSIAGSCTNTVGSYICTCNSGFELINNNCTDIDECSNSTLNDCHALATCTNMDGDFVCECNDGYTGNGTSCLEFDECTVYNYDCGPNGTCNNLVGGYNCTCDSGYETNVTADPLVCVDTNECGTSDNCATMGSVCTNTPGTFSCACSSGYTGDGTTCTDIDECATGTHGCHMNATCTNTPVGSRTCTCDANFMGDGVTCAEVGMLNYTFTAFFQLPNDTADTSTIESEVRAIVDALSITLESYTVVYMYTVALTGGWYQYVMRFNFVHMSLNEAAFNNLLTTRTFTLMINGVVPTAGDFGECLYTPVGNAEKCSNFATCTNTVGSFTCMCAAYTIEESSPIAGTNCTYPVDYVCGLGSVTVTLDVRILTQNSILPSTMSLGDCTNGVLDATNSTLTFTGYCGPNVTTLNSSHTNYDWKLTNTGANQSFYSSIPLTYTVRCIIPIVFNVTADVVVNNQDEVVAPVDIVAPGTVQSGGLSITRVNTLGQTQTGGATTGDTLSFQLSVPGNIFLNVRGCSVAAASNANQRIDVITGGCVNANAQQNTGATITGNGDSNSVSFSFRAFSFSRSTSNAPVTMVATFSVETCLVACPNTCSKRKRSLLDYRYKREVEEKTISITFTVVEEEKCLAMGANCGVGACVVDFDQNAQCICPENSIKLDDGSCAGTAYIDGGIDDDEGEEARDDPSTTLYVMIGLGCLVLILIAVIATVFLVKRNRSQRKEFDLSYVSTNPIAT